MKKVCKIGWVMAVILSQACHNAEKTTIKRFDRNPGFVTDDPFAKTGMSDGERNFYYHFLAADAGLTGLDSLEHGYDSLQIRVWLGHSLALTNHLVIISSTNTKWQAQLVTITTTNERPRKISRQFNVVKPKSGWEDFERSLHAFNIVNLPHSDYDSTCNECDGADGIGYFFEISTTSQYRCYEYCNPEIARGCPEAMTVLQFAAFLEKEFNFTYTK
jgi:hypothetical protein